MLIRLAKCAYISNSSPHHHLQKKRENSPCRSVSVGPNLFRFRTSKLKTVSWRQLICRVILNWLKQSERLIFLKLDVCGRRSKEENCSCHAVSLHQTKIFISGLNKHEGLLWAATGTKSLEMDGRKNQGKERKTDYQEGFHTSLFWIGWAHIKPIQRLWICQSFSDLFKVW